MSVFPDLNISFGEYIVHHNWSESQLFIAKYVTHT